MKVTYDPEADVLYVRLRDVPIADTATLDDGAARNVAVDLDEADEVVGFEITGASRLAGIDLESFAFELRHRREAAEPAAAE